MKRSSICGFLVALFFLSGIIFSGGILAQQQEPAKPGPEHEILKEMEGTWDCVMTMIGTPADAPPSKGTSVYKMECGGLWLTSTFQGNFGELKFEGRGIDGYDQTKKKYTGIWVDSMATTPMFFEGDYDAKTKTLKMSSDYPGPDGKPAKYKTLSTFKDKDHHTFKMFLVGEGGKEDLILTIEYTRKK